jgi:hypothetical protein
MVQFYGVTNITNSVNLKIPRLDVDLGTVELLGDYWTPDNPGSFWKAPRLATSTGQYSPSGDRDLFDGSYFRLKTMEMAYNLPAKWLSIFGITESRIFVNGNNLFFWSDLPIDIERGGSGSGNNNGYPTFRQFNVGVNITF